MSRRFMNSLRARALMGISEAFYIPAALALISEYHSGFTRSRAVGMHQTGIYAGQILGGFAGYVADSPEFGWRWAFSACGMIGVIYALPLAGAVARSRANQGRCRGQQRLRRRSESVFRGLLGNRNFLLLVLYFTLPAIAGWIVRDWMPDILKEKFRLGQGQAGVSAILFVQIASIVGAIIGGTLADRWMRTTPRGRIFTSAIGMMLFLPALFSVGNAGTLTMAVAGAGCIRLWMGMFRLQQHADSLPDRAARVCARRVMAS